MIGGYVVKGLIEKGHSVIGVDPKRSGQVSAIDAWILERVMALLSLSLLAKVGTKEK